MEKVECYLSTINGNEKIFLKEEDCVLYEKKIKRENALKNILFYVVNKRTKDIYKIDGNEIVSTKFQHDTFTLDSSSTSNNNLNDFLKKYSDEIDDFCKTIDEEVKLLDALTSYKGKELVKEDLDYRISRLTNIINVILSIRGYRELFELDL